MNQPYRETVRRTFNINNFESLTIEGSSDDPDPHKAFLLANKDCLVKCQTAMVRIFNVRKGHGVSNDYDEISYSMITSEIQGIDYELLNL